MDSHCQLHVWRLAGALTSLVYRITDRLPEHQRLVVTVRLQRAAWSVQNNIAEGSARQGRREMRKFIGYAIGSLAQVDSMLGTLPAVYAVDAGELKDAGDLLRRIKL
ncbi:MAG: four helix bundle protein [Gemmatimonadales bacterium]|nr:four helix bundle protein [Gemmatimonadales bacterium]NIN11094.1 four helix bundle protein [Gemmatimonadales bacterium]NIN49691.1 four helix bundle protein [Gemmatimonadales bacterium]NIP07155.1 four helix bundle protein [Gemmatimonadales bacterium]NIQ99546.1 four helix bundle protein [Gemmatimonadales bacterium]